MLVACPRKYIPAQRKEGEEARTRRKSEKKVVSVPRDPELKLKLEATTAAATATATEKFLLLPLVFLFLRIL